MPPTVIHPARTVRTLDPSRPTAAAVAVRDGHIAGAGAVDELLALGGDGEVVVDQRYAEHVIVPGFVEAHAHTYSGALWGSAYVGYFGRHGPDGRWHEGCRSVADVLDRLGDAQRALDDPGAPLTAWGLDPIYFGGEQLRAAHLDRVSATRQILVLHASNHLATVNSAVIAADGLADSPVPGIMSGPDGRPDGELREFPAMFQTSAMLHLFRERGTPAAIDRFARLAHVAGCTTVADLGGTPLHAAPVLDALMEATARDDFPERLSMFHLTGQDSRAADTEVALVDQLAARSTDKLRFGHVKMILDGSVQGFTARLLDPGYLGDRPNGMWLMTPERFRELFAAFHRAGRTVHVHCNGDEATELFVETVEAELAAHPRADHRHTVTHSQLTTADQYRRMAATGMAANVFANHIYFWGDQHRDVILGPDRAARIDAAATALAAGVRIALHSDEPVTPIGPLQSMAHAVQRRTASGEVLGPDECISPLDALAAVTLGPAYELHMDHEIGSIEAGKRADFTVLDDDPIDVAPDRIGDIRVVGTMLGGRWLPAP